MKKIIIFMITLALFASCNNEDVNAVVANPTQQSETITIIAGNSQFTATLCNNSSAKSFKAMLPLIVYMNDLNSNEKYTTLPNPLPTSSTQIDSILSGDIMLFGASTLVIFYKSFSNSYSYSPIAKIDNPKGLSSALGKNNITVTFELTK